MTCNNNQDFCVKAGETFHPTIRWATDQITSVPITAVSAAAPVVITAPGHNLTTGWPAAVIGAQGMPQINATRYPPQGADWHRVTVVSASQVAFNDESAADYTPYTSGGFLVYPTPAPLAGVAAVMNIYDTPDHSGTPVASLSSAAASITIDPVALTMTPQLQTAGVTWQLGYFKFDVTDANGVVTELMRGTLTIE
jgi:hypothetical protein